MKKLPHVLPINPKAEEIIHDVKLLISNPNNIGVYFFIDFFIVPTFILVCSNNNE